MAVVGCRASAGSVGVQTPLTSSPQFFGVYAQKNNRTQVILGSSFAGTAIPSCTVAVS